MVDCHFQKRNDNLCSKHCQYNDKGIVMTLRDLTEKLQNLCHEGHSLDEVFIDRDGNNTDLCDIEIRRCYFLGDEKKNVVSLVPWSK